MLARNATGEDLPFPATRPEATGDEDAVDLLELGDRLLVGHVLGVRPLDVDSGAVMQACMLERLVDGEVGVVELHVLADERDRHVLVAIGDPVGELLPHPEIGGRRVKAELIADERVEPLGLEPFRDEIDVGNVGRADHRVCVDIGEERDLLANVRRQRLARATHDHVGMDTDPAQLVHRVLGGLRLELTRSLDERDEGDVEIENVLGPDLTPELADRLEERQRLDVADGAADLGDDHVDGLIRSGAPDARLDLVRDVRNDLHGRAEELALALAPEHGVPDRPGRVAAVSREVLVDEALVVPEIEIGLGAVLGDEHLAVLERAHRARIDVEVRIELLGLDSQATRLEQPAERRGDDALAERGHDAAGDEHVLGLLLAHRAPPESVEVAENRRRLDEPAERATLSENREGGEADDDADPTSTAKVPHGLET